MRLPEASRSGPRRTARVMRLVYATPTWDDLVEVALDEIRAFGAGQYQVARRRLY